MIPLFAVFGTIVAAFVWSDYTDNPNSPTNIIGPYSEPNEWGEFYNPETGTWQLPDSRFPNVQLSERGKGIFEYFDGMFDLQDEKKTLMMFSILALVLFTKPWK